MMLRPFALTDAALLQDIHTVNREAFAPFMPIRDEQFFTVDTQRQQIEQDIVHWQADQGYAFAVVYYGQLMGRVALSNVSRGAWQSATLGYWIDGRFQRLGIATRAVQGCLVAAFNHLSLHRTQAAIMPHNVASLRVIEKTGFFYEGLAPYYLKIHGVWEDHRIYSLTVESFHRPIEWVVEE